MLNRTQKSSLAESFMKALVSIKEGSSNSESLKADFERKLYATTSKSIPKRAKKSVRSKKAIQLSKSTKVKAKPKTTVKTLRREALEDTFENRVIAQRKARKTGKFSLFAKKKKIDIADKVAKQREEREGKPKKIAKPKDPTKVRSRKPAI